MTQAVVEPRPLDGPNLFLAKVPQNVLLERVRAEFLEMPGLRLTVGQAGRLCGIRPESVQAILDTLVDSKFLCRKSNGVYVRLTEGDCKFGGDG